MISIILPIRNEANFIKKSMDSILAQDYPPDQIEILIADGMSTDKTREIVHIYQQNHPNIYLIDNPCKIVPTGMNFALRQAMGDIIIRVDGHTILAPDYVSQCVTTLKKNKASSVGGRMNAVGDTPFGEAVAIATSSPFGIGNARFHYSDKEEWVDTVYMGCWPKEVFQNIGLFDEELVRDQDDEFNYRLRNKGGKILLSPKIHSRYTVRSTPKDLWKQYFQYGYWKVRVLQKHPKQMSLRQFIPPLFVLSLLLTTILSVTTSWGWLTLTALTAIYLTANLIASFLTARTKGYRYFWSLPLAFTIIHVSYGLGFLFGLIKFSNRWHDKIGKVPQWQI